MKKSVFVITMFFIGTLLFVSCSKKKGVTLTNRLTFQLKSMNNKVTLSSALPNSSIANLTWDSGFVNIISIVSDLAGQEAGRGESAANSEPVITKVDLFGQSQSIGSINIAPGSYTNLNIRIEIAQNATSPALYLKGSYTNSAGAETPIEFSLNEGNVQNDANNQTQGDNQNVDPGQIEIGATAKNLVVGSNSMTSVTLYLDKLMTGIATADLDAATKTGGAIVVNKASNINIYSKIKTNLTSSSDIN